MPELDLIGQFVTAYQREVDFYTTAGSIAQQQIESALRSAGIRAIVTSRAKRPDGLESKLRKRARDGTDYKTLDGIRADIADLAGVRVALYFPGQRPRVNQLVATLFVPLWEPKTFPDPQKRLFDTSDGRSYEKRFAGYRATHHRVRLREDKLTEDERRFSSARIEVQVASVLMHAWAEVEHDLIYKPLSGALSTDEHAILDELNGLVLTGEISLERLEQAMERRIEETKAPFENQYELASFLFDHVQRAFGKAADEEEMGHADWLFSFLEKLNLNSPEKLRPFLDVLAPEFESRPIADQVIDTMVGGDKERYELFEAIREMALRYGPTAREDLHRSIGAFIQRWISLEECLNKILRHYRGPVARPPLARHELHKLSADGVIDRSVVDRIDRVRQFRNVLVHGETKVTPDLIDEAREKVVAILKELAGSELAEVREPAVDALSKLAKHDELDDHQRPVTSA